MTMRYAHLAPERLRAAVSRLEGLTAGDSTASSAQASTQEACPPKRCCRTRAGTDHEAYAETHRTLRRTTLYSAAAIL